VDPHTHTAVGVADEAGAYSEPSLPWMRWPTAIACGVSLQCRRAPLRPHRSLTLDSRDLLTVWLIGPPPPRTNLTASSVRRSSQPYPSARASEAGAGARALRSAHPTRFQSSRLRAYLARGYNPTWGKTAHASSTSMALLCTASSRPPATRGSPLIPTPARIGMRACLWCRGLCFGIRDDCVAYAGAHTDLA
jgi:hypothetical protein